MKYLVSIITILLTVFATNAQTPAENKFTEGLRHYLNSDYDMAVTSYSEAIKLDSTYARAYFERARIYHKLKQPDKAIGDFTLCLLYDKKNIDAYMQRGGILMEKELYDNALNDFTLAIKLDTNNAILAVARIR
jgi:tetratricopeptide (TPR) repeat protein